MKHAVVERRLGEPAIDDARQDVIYWAEVLHALEPQLGTKDADGVEACWTACRARFLDACFALAKALRDCQPLEKGAP
jgi:hypothetical protein